MTLWGAAVLLSCAVLGADTLNLSEVACGEQQILSARQGKIVGGKAAYRGQFPWMVSIQHGGKHFCGGAIIASRYVLTASHCLHSRSAGSLSVIVGDHDLRRAEGSQRRHQVAEVIRHDSYRYPSFRNDIALLRLTRKIMWNQYSQPVCLPDEDEAPHQGDPATVSGWGWLDEHTKGGQRADVLQRVYVPLVSAATCTRWYHESGGRARGVTLRAGQLCAGYKSGGKDGCQGDSGGPLVSRRDGHYTLVGLVSAGIGCARPNLPGIYTDVHRYVDWVVSNVVDDKSE